MDFSFDNNFSKSALWYWSLPISALDCKNAEQQFFWAILQRNPANLRNFPSAGAFPLSKQQGYLAVEERVWGGMTLREPFNFCLLEVTSNSLRRLIIARMSQMRAESSSLDPDKMPLLVRSSHEHHLKTRAWLDLCHHLPEHLAHDKCV